MFIPFGKKEPDEKDREFLTKLGLDLNNIKHVGRYYLLEVPTQNPDIKCTPYKPTDRKTNYSIRSPMEQPPKVVVLEKTKTNNQQIAKKSLNL
ncbi:MAG: hypothetical protein H0U70_03125 [Tatlockia sp.]|nr:hypothetical protein [Tatlockia sp.]